MAIFLTIWTRLCWNLDMVIIFENLTIICSFRNFDQRFFYNPGTLTLVKWSKNHSHLIHRPNHTWKTNHYWKTNHTGQTNQTILKMFELSASFTSLNIKYFLVAWNEDYHRRLYQTPSRHPTRDTKLRCPVARAATPPCCAAARDAAPAPKLPRTPCPLLPTHLALQTPGTRALNCLSLQLSDVWYHGNYHVIWE